MKMNQQIKKSTPPLKSFQRKKNFKGTTIKKNLFAKNKTIPATLKKYHFANLFCTHSARRRTSASPWYTVHAAFGTIFESRRVSDSK